MHVSNNSPGTLDYAGPGEPAPPSHRLAQAGSVCAAGVAATILTFVMANLYGSIRGGEVFIFSMLPVLASGGVAFVVGLIPRTSTRRFKTGLAAFTVAPAVLIFTSVAISDARARAKAPYDRFRDHVADPIPASVSRVWFAPYDQWADTDLEFHFLISEADFGAILTSKHFKRISPDHPGRPNDPFFAPGRPALGPADEFYQAGARYDGVYTVRVNQEHTHVVWRYEEQKR